MSSDFESQFKRELLAAVRLIAESHELIAEAMHGKSRSRSKQGRRRLTRDERAALAFIAVARGANSYAEIARQQNIHPSTAQRNPGIRRALNTARRDRRGNKFETDDFGWSE